MLGAILKIQVCEVGASDEKKLYAKYPVQTKIKLWSAAILIMVAMWAAILKIQIHELGAGVEKILYAKNPFEIRTIKHWLAAILNMAAILKKEVDKNHFGSERILCAENLVKICYRGEDGHTDARTHRRASPYEKVKELALAKSA